MQEARKSSGLEVSDRIELWWTGDGALAEALAEHAGAVGRRGAGHRGARRDGGHGAGVEGPAASRFWLARAGSAQSLG